MNSRDRFRGCLLGLAAGDAVGTTVEFRERGSFEPVTDMVGGGAFGLEPGQWTDDTSMALCLATSLVERGGFDPRDQIERYCRWADEGYLSSNGRCFDIGGTVSSALARFSATGNHFAGSTDKYSAGNGSIMRLAPVPMFFFPDIADAEHHAAESSKTTHGTAECLDACRLMARMLVRALSGATKEQIADGDADDFEGEGKIIAIARGGYRDKGERAISGSGYVVESLEAALWCFMHSDSFEEAILKAANLGDDADTTAAVCGQIAGAHYGELGIPPAWLKKLTLRDEIVRLADRLFEMIDSEDSGKRNVRTD
jgi:ADP-ribosyl-[dinitrogen reductase] hydrolase